MKIFGLDFTSAPGSKKPITAAVCDLNDELLRVNEILRLDSFTAFESFLRIISIIRGEKSDHWVEWMML